MAMISWDGLKLQLWELFQHYLGKLIEYSQKEDSYVVIHVEKQMIRHTGKWPVRVSLDYASMAGA
jgi:hypothetical protein